MEGKTLLRVFIVVSCLAVTALGYRNSNGDNTDAIALATKAACRGDDCSASLGQQARSSFGHEYSFAVVTGKGAKGGGGTVIVECKRELVFIGDWHCQPKP
ncbi:MAG TPA: hypothetical protein VIW29_09530 [Polyangiaceae bacterium]